MKYSVNNYVDALVDVLKHTPENKRAGIVAGFIKLIKKTGDIKSAVKIIKAVEKKITQEGGGRWVEVDIARELSESSAKSVRNKFSKKDHVTFNINPELVAGIRVTINGEEELDNSLHNKLNKLFK